MIYSTNNGRFVIATVVANDGRYLTLQHSDETGQQYQSFCKYGFPQRFVSLFIYFCRMNVNECESMKFAAQNKITFFARFAKLQKKSKKFIEKTFCKNGENAKKNRKSVVVEKSVYFFCLFLRI